MFIHRSACISPLSSLEETPRIVDGRLRCIEPKYPGIPLGQLRRMGRAVRTGVGAAQEALQGERTSGIIVGTANGGMEDCIRFLNQVIEYREGTLTPTNFVQSTSNAIAGQLALGSGNGGYNITHVHRGLAFENALVDCSMQLQQHAESSYVVCGVDEISAYNYNIERLGGWHKKNPLGAAGFYGDPQPGSIAGEGAAAFVISNRDASAAASIQSVGTYHGEDLRQISERLKRIRDEHGIPDLLLSGENGDPRFASLSEHVGDAVSAPSEARFKHLCGEYPTSSAFALWLSVEILRRGTVPAGILKSGKTGPVRSILIVNHYKGVQHGMIRLSACI